MSDLYEEKLLFAEFLGYKCVADAIKVEGFIGFNLKFKNSSRKTKPVTEKKYGVRRKHSDTSIPRPYPNREDPVSYPIEDVSSGGTTLMFDKNYLIFSDGRVWSIFNKMFLVPIKRSNRGKVYFNYLLRGRKQFNIAKLVWLHFGEHILINYSEVGELFYKDGDPLNFGIENLMTT